MPTVTRTERNPPSHLSLQDVNGVGFVEVMGTQPDICFEKLNLEDVDAQLLSHGNVVDRRPGASHMEGVLLPGHSVDQVKLAADLSELPTKNHPGRNAAQVVMQVEVDAGQFEVEDAGRKSQIARNLIRAGGFCESLLRKVDVAELVVVRVVSQIQLDRLFKVFAGRVEVFFLVVGVPSRW